MGIKGLVFLLSILTSVIVQSEINRQGYYFFKYIGYGGSLLEERVYFANIKEVGYLQEYALDV